MSPDRGYYLNKKVASLYPSFQQGRGKLFQHYNNYYTTNRYNVPDTLINVKDCKCVRTRALYTQGEADYPCAFDTSPNPSATLIFLIHILYTNL